MHIYYNTIQKVQTKVNKEIKLNNGLAQMLS